MSLGGLVQLWDDPNQTGRSEVLAVGPSQRYELRRESDLLAFGMDHVISSSTVFHPSEGGLSLICFGFPFPLPWFDFSGPFLQLTAFAADSTLSTNMSSFGFDDRTSSALLVNIARGTETRLSFRSVFLSKWLSIIDAQLAGTRASRKDGREPILTWEMFPTFINPDLRFLRITQELNIDVPAWPDYDAAITYWLLPSLDAGGKIQATVARTGLWVDDGVKHDKIVSELEPAVAAGAGTLNSELNTQLAPFRAFTLKDIYLLPGDQTGGTPAGAFAGTTTDDITIVLVS